MSQLGTVYATKRRRRNGKSLKPPPKDGVTKSNPSKRHRERLNAELDLLASLLPFEQNILSKLDRLSILRLSVSYLRTKSYFQVVMHKEKEENGVLHIHHHQAHDSYRSREIGIIENGLLDGDMFLQALNGFLMILTCEGEVFFATHSIESYLGFHQSDIIHQSVYELVHSEDREELQRQLLWNSFLPADLSGMPLSEALAPEKLIYLERSFTVRFRCLLDNTSGFLRLDIRGRVKILHGQNRKTEEPPLGLFAFCTPFGPPSLLEIPQKENMFKSKHKLDLSLVSMDQRGKLVLGYSDSELANLGGYDLVHYDDLSYVASAHQELLKTGASGMIAYRFQKKDGEWQWLQTSSRLVYKNSKPDFVICTHRQLMEEEGRDLLGKRTMDFKVSYLDTGLSSSYFTDADQLLVAPNGSPTTTLTGSTTIPVTTPRTNRRYKTQLRDFLSTCRSKRKISQQNQPTPSSQTTPTGTLPNTSPANVEMYPDPAAVAVAYSNLNHYAPSPYAPPSADNLYMTAPVHSTNFYPAAENLFHQYRLQGVSSYYPDYHHAHHHHHPHINSPTYVANGFLAYDGYAGLPSSVVGVTKEEKWHQEDAKYYGGDVGTGAASRNPYNNYSSPTHQQSHVNSAQSGSKTPKASPSTIMDVTSCSSSGVPSPIPTVANGTNGSTTPSTPCSTSSVGNVLVQPKIETSPPPAIQPNYADQTQRQTVLMWGSGASNQQSATDSDVTSSPAHTKSPTLGNSKSQTTASYHNDNYSSHHRDNVSQNQLHQHQQSSLKWNGSVEANTKELVSVYPLHDNIEIYSTGNAQSEQQQQQQLQHQQHHLAHHHQQSLAMGNGNSNIGSNCEVWPSTYSQYQYFTYHHAPNHQQHTSTQSSCYPALTTNKSPPSTTSQQQQSLLTNDSNHQYQSSPILHQTPRIATAAAAQLQSVIHNRAGVLCCPSLR